MATIIKTVEEEAGVFLSATGMSRVVSSRRINIESIHSIVRAADGTSDPNNGLFPNIIKVVIWKWYLFSICNSYKQYLRDKTQI